MELRRAADLIFRSPLTPFANRSTTQYIQPSRIRHISNPLSISSNYSVSRCTFATTSRNLQWAAQAKESPSESDDKLQTEPLEPEKRVNIAERHTFPPPTSNSQRSRPRDRDDRFKFLTRAARAPSTPPRSPSSTAPNPKSSAPPPSPRDLVPGAGLDFLRGRGSQRSQDAPPRQNVMTSLDELTHGLAAREISTPYREGDKQRTDLSDMQRPGGFELGTKHAATQYKKNLELAMEPPPFRLGPTLGRTVSVDASKNIDVARAFTLVNVRCASNKVRQDARSQLFYERPGTRRKRLLSERWRRRFKENFKATVRRVEEMRRKGW